MNQNNNSDSQGGYNDPKYFNLDSWDCPYGHQDQVGPTQAYKPYHYRPIPRYVSQTLVPSYGQNPNPAFLFHQQEGAPSAYYATLAAAYGHHSSGVTLPNTANPVHINKNSNYAHKKTLVVQWCEICKIACDTRDVLEIHKSGKKHRENLEKLEGRPTNTNPFHRNTNGSYARKKTKVVHWCEVCKIACDTRDVLDLHKLGKKHKDNLEKLEGRPTNTNPVHRNTNGNYARKKTKVVHRCEICKIACDTEVVLGIHKSGKKHMENLEKLRGSTNSSPALAIVTVTPPSYLPLPMSNSSSID